MTRPRRPGSRSLLRMAAGAVSAVLLLAGVPSTSTADPAGDVRTSLVARFGPRDASFAESVAGDSGGSLYVSHTTWGQATNVGRIVRVRPSGGRRAFSAPLRLGPTAMFVGVAVNGRDQVFVARYDFGGTAPSEVLQVTAHGARTVATLPAGSWPNGLTFHHGLLYVGDATLGHVWRFRPSEGVRHLSRPWLHDSRLTPARGEAIGVNGLAFWGNQLFALNYTRDTLLQVPLRQDGRPGTVRQVVQLASLHTADGIAFDRQGRLWVTVNGTGKPGKRPHDQRLLRLSRSGDLELAVEDAPWMNYPTAVVRGRTPATADRMFVTDGAFNGGMPDLRSFTVE